MKKISRLNEEEKEFLEGFDLDFHLAMKKLMIKVKGEELTDPKYWELVKKINDLQKQVDDIQNIVDDRSGGY